MTGAAGWHHLTAGGVSLLVEAVAGASPRVLWWGAELGSTDLAAVALAAGAAGPHGGVVASSAALLFPNYAEGDASRPALAGHRGGVDFSPLPKCVTVDSSESALAITSADESAALSVRTDVEISESGLLRLRHAVTNTGDSDYVLDGVAAALPIPGEAAEVLDFTGRWSRERSPQRRPMTIGAVVRDSRRGRTGHDATTLMCAGEPGFGFRHGQVWAVHVAWSGNHSTYAERTPSGLGRLGGGELLLSGEVILAAGAEYVSPWLFAVYSGAGLDGVSASFHRWLRARTNHPKSPRPIVLNTWEAVYFQHDLEKLCRLADAAAEVGVERFVLDDGWFGSRRDDTSGLGDWYVSAQVWPEGLSPLIDYVRGLGMQFGLWVEPEMINPDSELARAHPDWIMSTGGRLPAEVRHQQVLDIGNPAAYAYIFERLDALLTEYPISFVKWDHNRDLVDAGQSGAEPHNRAGVHRQTLAIYRLLDELRAKHPGVEVESCSSGGARIDLEILQRTDRVWTSDCNDALERQAIQRWTGLLLPPELMGAHVGPTESHTTGRVHSLSFRAVAATFGHSGMEWDIASITAQERARLRTWVSFVKDHRDLLHSGDVVRADYPDPAGWVHGVVATDRSCALFAYVQMASTAFERPLPVQLPGLDPDRCYLVRPVYPAGPTRRRQPDRTGLDGGRRDRALRPRSRHRWPGSADPAP
ncbi:alpha-galactosidase [Fodinicola feengrottensis]|uniref:alpha-galactosidase n=1 Tax=Fodinicola feengrottensis TaxID=435914 RepID=UPI0024411572|nr:alpha-galactosidase [Fodinicola feengrottensis]